MRWINVDSLFLESPEFCRATNEQIGIWLKLVSYCSKHENNGILVNAQNWPAELWNRLGIDPTQLAPESPLWFFRQPNLFVEGYNTQWQALIEERRKMGQSRSETKRAAVRVNGKKGGRPRKFIRFPDYGNSNNQTI